MRGEPPALQPQSGHSAEHVLAQPGAFVVLHVRPQRRMMVKRSASHAPCEDIPMNAETIREYLRREPFEPFVIRMSNGETHEIRHPECAFVMKTRVIVYYPDDDRSVTCSLVHINSVEALQAR
jgi:hypothetical protein